MTSTNILEVPMTGSDAPIPLVVDLDGTLIKTDMLYESVLQLVSDRPTVAINLPLRLKNGIAKFKADIAEQVDLDVAKLPYNEQLLDFIRTEKSAGRPVYLASASNRRYVEAVAKHLGLFDGVFASDQDVNLKGKNKAKQLSEAFGEGQFDYVGDSRADLDVWSSARRAIAVNCSAHVAERLAGQHSDHEIMERRNVRAKDYIAAVRVHQWSKNALLFLPMFAAHAINATNIGLLLLAFLSFSLIASSIYIVNDLMDLSSDRDHPVKRFRPLASGAVPIPNGIVLSIILFLVGSLVASAVSIQFLAVIVFYLFVTTAYSLYLKRKMVVDVLTLAGLYTLRVFAGAVAVAVPLSPWMLAFSMFLFLCLALVKRYTELKSRIDSGKDAPSGRGYLLEDVPLIMSQACAAGYAAVVVLALYVNSPTVVQLYNRPEGLWLACGLLLYWITRLLMVAHRGKMHHDPIVFALRDRVSLATVVLTGVVVLGSAAL